MSELPRSDDGRFLPGNNYSQMTQFKKGEHHSSKTEFKQGEHRSISTEFKPGEKRGPLPESIKRKLSERFSGAGNPQFGKTSPMKGKHHSLETRQKIGAKSKGHIMPIQTRTALINANIGNTYTQGATPFNKGKTFDELYGKEDAEKRRTNISTHFKNYFSDKHPWNFIDGHSQINEWWGLSKEEYFELRDAILQRDGNACQSCGSSVRLHVHHIFPRNPFFGFGTINDESNLISLCIHCHKRIEWQTFKWLQQGENPLELLWEVISS